ncbi:TnsA endonuclease C terminal [Paenibacillus algorifonticola]|uniref:TnsA endonuclease C terminal n=1 Tax=Paenibacillus algorifonticola TaxID=684063 RepID=A0A1I2H3D7_9BACL|nr:TnsA endonuclease N-terminal domain-containing protein [Paenibacillus algorifonticola]SFF23839.1 TnsA endonuclease C terminal [Paenibacillus algorifonticola]
MMAKRKREITQAKIEKFIKEGRGQGSGKDYLPWLRIQDVPSEGRATRGVGWTTGRRHELLSDIERDYCYLLDYSDDVSDIREQFPLLPLEETEMIAEKLGVEHPADPKTGVLIVMTTDFLITYKDKNYARTLKPKSELENERTIAKFEIERMYWETHNVDWGIVTDFDLPDTLVRNIEWVHKEFHNDDVTDLGVFVVQNLQRVLSERLYSGESIARACLACDEQIGVEIGTSLALFRHFIARKIWSVNMNERIVPTLAPKEFVVNEIVERLAKGG